MQTEKIIELLEEYNRNRSRHAYLEVAILELSEQIDKAKSQLLVNEVMRSAEMDGMPKGNAVTSQVENLAVRIADGWTPDYIKEMEKEKAELIQEKESLRRKIAYVDAWLMALNDKQKWVIDQHIICGKSWAELIFLWQKENGAASKATMKRLRDSAMTVIENICRRPKIKNEPEMSRI